MNNMNNAVVAPVAVVTGSASGIGKECVTKLVQTGWRVFALDIATQSNDDFKCKKDDVICIRTDVRDEQSIAQAFKAIAAQTNCIDALICSAGVLRMGNLVDMTSEDFDTMLAVNTRGPWLCTKYALPLLRSAASPSQPARVVMVGSIASLRPKVGGGAYSASKAALSRLVRVMAVELASDKVLVNAVAPSTVDTPMIQAAMKPRDGESYNASGVSPLGRVAQPTDVVSVIELLLSPGANYITGTWIPVDGGTSAAFGYQIKPA